MQFILTLGYPKKDHARREEWTMYGACALQLIDWETGTLVKEVRHITPPDKIAPDGSVLFKSGTIFNRHLVVPSNTEILVYDLPRLELKRVYSHPTFNDLHHVIVHNDLFYICNTGLEIVQVMHQNGDMVAEYNVGYSDTWKRFSKDIDYRLVPTTKPHETHANHLFVLEGQLWCTRFWPKDAICLEDPSKRIDLSASNGHPHDGLVQGDFIYFTLTDGYLVIVHKNTLKREEIVDFNEISRHRALLGWCRGVDVVGGRAYVGFTALRTSKYREYGIWIKHGKKPLGSRIAEYDLNHKTLVKEYPVARETGAAIFTVKNVSFP